MAYTNLYHIFYKMPVLEKKDMYVELEEIAEALVKSGLLRIDAEPKQNFTRFSQPTRNVHIVFTKRELYEEHLLPRTRQLLHKALSDAGVRNLDSQVNKEIERLRQQLKKHIDIEPELEMKLARILLQSSHPVVFLMILLEKVQVFISYGQNIGEVMDVVSWQQAGSNSGMQSTDGKNVAIFVSCGGDPLLLEPLKQELTAQEKTQQQEEEKIYGDGKPALGRLMAIAGQEIGHYSDITHDDFGKQMGRHSANFRGTRANEQVNLARTTDMENIQTFWNMLNQIGLRKLQEKEQDIQFFARNPDKTLGYRFKYLTMIISKKRFVYLAKKMKFWPIDEIKDKEFLGLHLDALLGDMMFNLQPVADVYSSEDKNEEIAIACIEALARVPQQANKWGHKSTLFFWRNLYKFYYYKVIPRCISDYERMSGEKFSAYPNKMRKYTWSEKIKLKFEAWKNKK